MRLLRRDGDPLAQIRPGFTRRFTIYDEDDQLAIVKAAYRTLGLEEKEFMQYRAAISRISHSKNLKLAPADLYKQAVNRRPKSWPPSSSSTKRRLRAANALDFDDLLLEAVRLLRHDDATREAWNRRLSYVMVDEYQDTNRSQYELMRLLSESHATCAWWATRTSPSIAGAARTSATSWISSTTFPTPAPSAWSRITAPPRTFWRPPARWWRTTRRARARSSGPKPAPAKCSACTPATTPRTKRCSWPTASRSILAAQPRRPVAVLYRTNFQSRQIEEALRRYGRKYNIVGGFSFYQRAEIKDIVAYLKLAVSNTDSASLLRVINTPARGIGRTTVEQIERYAREQGYQPVGCHRAHDGRQELSTRSQSSLVAFRNLIQEISLVAGSSPLPELIRFILERTGYRKMLEQERTPEARDAPGEPGRIDQRGRGSRRARRRRVRFSGPRRAGFRSRRLRRARARAPYDPAQRQGSGVSGGLPDRHGTGSVSAQPRMDSEAALEEERRLCYVGMTRAGSAWY